jgi:RIO kinase 1
VEAAIAKEQAEPLYLQLRGEIIKILSQDLIHGDLSEFNILLGANGPVIIDLPQVVTAAKNSQSEKYFRRDLGNMLRFFSSIDPSLNAKHANDADEIWRAYVRRYLSTNFVPGGRSQQQQQHQQRPQHHQQNRGGPPRQGQGPGQQRGPGQQGPAQQQRGQGFQRGPGQPQQQQGGRPQGQPNPQRSQNQQGGQQGGRPQQQQGGRPQGQQQNQQRRGPEVSFRGAPPAPRNDAAPPAHASQSHAGHGGGDFNDARRTNGPRRRPPRRF